MQLQNMRTTNVILITSGFSLLSTNEQFHGLTDSCAFHFSLSLFAMHLITRDALFIAGCVYGVYVQQQQAAYQHNALNKVAVL